MAVQNLEQDAPRTDWDKMLQLLEKRWARCPRLLEDTGGPPVPPLWKKWRIMRTDLWGQRSLPKKTRVLRLPQ